MIISFPNSWWYFSISSRWLFQFKKNEPALVTCITNWPSRSSFFRQSAFAKRWIASIGILFFLIRVSLASQWITRSSCPLVLGRKLMTTMLVGDSLKNVCSNANTHHPLKFLIFFMFPCSHLGSVNYHQNVFQFPFVLVQRLWTVLVDSMWAVALFLSPPMMFETIYTSICPKWMKDKYVLRGFLAVLIAPMLMSTLTDYNLSTYLLLHLDSPQKPFMHT